MGLPPTMTSIPLESRWIEKYQDRCYIDDVTSNLKFDTLELNRLRDDIEEWLFENRVWYHLFPYVDINRRNLVIRCKPELILFRNHDQATLFKLRWSGN